MIRVYLSPISLLSFTLSLSSSLYLSLCVCVCFRLPRSLRLTPSFLSLGLNPESAPGIREDLAVEEISNLDGSASHAMSGWVEQAQRRLVVEQALRLLSARVAAISLTMPSP